MTAPLATSPATDLEAAAHRPPTLSVVIAARNEAQNLPVLLDEIDAALTGALSYEVVVTDDGSDDDTSAVLDHLALRRPWLIICRHTSACGQSAGMRTAILAARGSLIATIDGDGQNDPVDLPNLIGTFGNAPSDVGMVIGWRQKRNDTWRKRKASRIANRLRSRILRDGTPDTGCGLKVFRRETFLLLPYFDHMHRFMPALMRREGLRAVSVPVLHRARLAGKSNYGVWDRALVGVVDILGVLWLQQRRRLPR